MKLKIDGTSYAYNEHNEDAENETLNNYGNGMTQITQPTELGEALKLLNDDSIEPDTRMSAIDMKANLHWVEVNSLLALDSLVALKVLPPACLAFSRQKKRLSVSLGARGRSDIVQISAGKRENDMNKENKIGFMGVKK